MVEDLECEVIPKLCATYLNLVKLTELNSFPKLEAELEARGIGGWTPHAEGGKESHAELRALLPYIERDGVKYLEGGIEADVDMTDEELSEDESDDDSDAGGCSVM